VDKLHRALLPPYHGDAREPLWSTPYVIARPHHRGTKRSREVVRIDPPSAFHTHHVDKVLPKRSKEGSALRREVVDRGVHRVEALRV
jgi:hypothetical protein